MSRVKDIGLVDEHRVMWKDQVVGSLGLAQNDDAWEVGNVIFNFFKFEYYCDFKNERALIPGLFPRKIENGKLVPVPLLSPSDERIRQWLTSRVVPPDRENIREILKSAGMSMYSVWELNKHTKSITLDDYYWITDNEYDEYEEIHPRYLIDTGQMDKLQERIKLGMLP